MAQDYKSSMNLPRTEFPMRANLSQREPEWLKFWNEIDLYRRSLEIRSEGPASSCSTTARRTPTATSTWAPRTTR